MKNSSLEKLEKEVLNLPVTDQLSLLEKMVQKLRIQNFTPTQINKKEKLLNLSKNAPVLQDQDYNDWENSYKEVRKWLPKDY